MRSVARESDRTDCSIANHAFGGLAAPRPANVNINGRPAIRLGDAVMCAEQFPDVVAEGTAQVRVGGLPLTSVGNHSLHPACVVSGSPDVNVGGEVFALPANIVIEGTAAFQSKVLRDQWLLWNTKAGRSMLEEIRRNGKRLTIVDASVDPARAILDGVEVVNRHNATTDDGDGGSTIHYQADRPYVTYGESEVSQAVPISSPPQVNLAHEMAHAIHFARNDSLPRDKEEQRARGEGIANQDDPWSENAVRDDLNLPPRAGPYSPASSPVEAFKEVNPDAAIDGPMDLRPGG